MLNVCQSPGDRSSIPSQVIPKTQKMVLDISLLKTQHYKVWIKGKWNNPGKRVAPSSTLQCSSYWKESLWVALNHGQTTYLFLQSKSFSEEILFFFLSLYNFIFIFLWKSIWVYIYIYIVIHRQTISLYHNSSVLLDTQDASSLDRNPANFTSAWEHNLSSLNVTEGILMYIY